MLYFVVRTGVRIVQTNKTEVITMTMTFREPRLPSKTINRPLPPQIAAVLVIANQAKCLCVTTESAPSSEIASWAEGQNEPGAYVLFVDDLAKGGRKVGD